MYLNVEQNNGGIMLPHCVILGKMPGFHRQGRREV